MRTSNRSVCPPCTKRVSVTSRTAVYGPVRTVVWEGRGREAPPYPDQSTMSRQMPVAIAAVNMSIDLRMTFSFHVWTWRFVRS
jgi:hypothetical protein